MMKMTKEKPWGVFCDVFGISPRNRVLEIFLEGKEIDNCLGNVAKEGELNRATVYNVINSLLKEKIIVTSRIIGRTQLYKLNAEKDEAKMLIKAFDDTLRLVG